MSEDEVKTLYALAKQALADKDYNSAIDSLKRILVLDENYRDASRLLAQTIRLKRRRWYNDWRIWGPVAGMMMIGLLAWLAFTVDWKQLVPTSLGITPSVNITNTPSPIATWDLIPTAYTWKRIYMAQELTRNNITSIVVDPRDPDVIYVGMQGAGIYKTIDGGRSWQPAYRGLNRAFVSRLIIDPQNPKTLYADVANSGIYKTTDSGLNWKMVLPDVGMLAMDSGHLYAWDAGLLYTSMDGGTSWSKRQTPSCPDETARLVVDPNNTGELFIHFYTYGSTGGCDSGFYRSEDGGETWNFTSTDGMEINRIFLPKGPGASIYASLIGRGLVRSYDLGKTWESLLDTSCFTLAFDPALPERILCGTEGALMLTEDNGETWRSVLDTEGLFFAIVFSTDAVFAGGANGTGFYVSQDGGYTWSERTNGLGVIAFNLHIPPNGDRSWYIDGEGGIFRSVDEGKTWSVIDTRSYFLAGDNGGTVYRIGGDYELLRSRDGGQTWQSMALPPPTASGIGVMGIGTICQQSDTVLALFPEGYYLSTDGGKTWDAASTSAWSQMQLSIFGVPRLYSDITCQQLYVLSGGNQVLYSHDGGANWAVCTSTEAFPPNALTLDPNDGQRVVLGTMGGGIFISTDGCRSWEKRNSGLNSLFVNSVAIDPNRPDILYAGTDGGAYVSFNGGETWSQVNDGLLGATVVYSIAVDQDSNVYAATPYGIFKLEK